MGKDYSNEVFSLIDEMYEDVKNKSNDPDILRVLLKAAKAFNKGMYPPIVAAKTVNGITIQILLKKPQLGDLFGKDYNRLTMIAREGGYKWGPTGIGDLRIQFE
ncbi:bacteriocin immunity protein [Companilactobacillus kimchiensis]|nr:bacteriocin immunity protein [Companilactobacillus kimchiensis]